MSGFDINISLIRKTMKIYYYILIFLKKIILFFIRHFSTTENTIQKLKKNLFYF